ncbi:MAG: xanthine dehydrogenase family protein molybdopterin-binding subunit [Ardenticatenaceae bacterium]|nr:xanthine dehydrogenase family protein molybdopterin-binding subunit [Ardenticatenaceae bacterium]MCB8946458.1 xanthine dehydrogenase family protein molybdopterin-binding subunit [Ardenticatenaceae bacterium]
MSDPKTQSQRKWRVTRRGFLIGAGATGAALAIGVAVGRRPFYRFIAGMASGMSAENMAVGGLDNDPFTWIEILPDNEITIYISKVEMGQGVHTSIAQMAAEELGVRWDQLTIRQSGSLRGPNTNTGGSTSVSSTYVPVRQAAAMMREMLILKAAEKMGVPAADLEAKEAAIYVKANPNESMTYGEVVDDVTEWPEIDVETIELKPSSEFEFIGKSLPRVDFESKLTGTAIYGYDVQVEGMLYGAVARPPTIGATMQSARAGDAADMPGAVQVVIDEEARFAGVVARTRLQAQAAVRALDIEWDEGRLWQQEELEALLSFENERDGYTIQEDGDAASVIGDEPTVSAEYFTPFAAHAHLEPQAAMADVQADSVTIYCATQAQGTIQSEVSSLTGIEPENINVVPTYLGGGFGRRLNTEVANEAVRLSQAVGAPVHVGWFRVEDMRNGYFRPPTRSQMSARLENGRISAINHDHASGPVAFPFFPTPMQFVMGTDIGSWRGAFNFYQGIENRRFTTWLIDFPIRTGWWRGLGLLANVFATESFMDELAYTAQVDPLQFRLNHLGSDPFSERMRGVLMAAAAQAHWGEALPEGHAHGIACATDVDTVVAQVVELSLDETSGEIQIHKVTCAVDAGLFINPDGAIAQTEGAIIMGLSSTLIEEITVRNGAVEADNFGRYPLMTIDRTPEIEVILLESDGQPRGMGEPPMGPIAAAVGNAFFALTGTRLRRLPFKPEYVLEAVAS